MSSSRVRAVATIPRRPKLAFQFVTLLMALGVPNTRAQPATPGADVQPAPTQPQRAPRYWLRVAGDRVNIRSRADLNSRIVGRANRDDVLEALGSDHGWHRVVPPTGVFSLVSAQYIERVGADRGIVRVATSLRVRVGSDLQPRDPLLSEVQARLEPGAEVRIVGEGQGQWLRIVPPVGVYVFISDDHVERITEEVARRLGRGHTPRPAETVLKSKPSMLAAARTRPAERPDLTSPWSGQLAAIEAEMRREESKPEAEQSWKPIVDQLRPIAAQRAEPQVAELAADWMEMINQYEREQAAVDVAEQADREKAQYARDLQKIRREGDALKRTAEFDARGILRPSFALEPGPYGLRYKLLDSFTHRVQAYVEFPPDLGIDVKTSVGKYVGVRGERQSVAGVKVPLLRVTRMTVLNPDRPAARSARETPD